MCLAIFLRYKEQVMKDYMIQTRYKKLTDYFPLEWIPNSPVEIIKGAILLDQVENKVILQLKLCNNSDKIITSVHLQVKCYDETGEAVHEHDNDINYAYQDLNIPPYTTFGDQQPILLVGQKARKVDITFIKVMFADGNIIPIDGHFQVRKYPNLKELDYLGNELTEELSRIITESNQFEKSIIPQTFDDGTWACSCGKLNLEYLPICERCRREKNWQFEKINIIYLQESLDEYKKQLAAQQQEREKLHAYEQNERIIAKKKKQRKIIKAVSVTALICAIAYSGYLIAAPRIQFTLANQKLENGSYEEAKAAFLELGNYKNAEDMVKESDYQLAIANREKGEFTDSITTFSQLQDYRDSSEQMVESSYQYASHLNADKDYEEAAAQFEQIKSYKDSKDRYNESLYKSGLASMKSGHYDKALTSLEKVKGYKDSKDRMAECKYQIAQHLSFSNKKEELELARTMFKQLGGYNDSAKHIQRLSTMLRWHGKWYKLRYEEWFAGEKIFDKKYGLLGDYSFSDYLEIDYQNKELTNNSNVANLKYDFTVVGDTLIADLYGEKGKYKLSGDKLVIEKGRYKITYVNEDKMYDVEP